jgi:hypothetical protein
VNVHHPIEEPATRALLAWALRTGAAAALIPPDLDWTHAALWVRPTVLTATVGELVAAEAFLAARGERRLRSWRGPLRRLRVVVALDGDEAAFAPDSFWRRLGVVCVAGSSAMRGV